MHLGDEVCDEKSLKYISRNDTNIHMLNNIRRNILSGFVIFFTNNLAKNAHMCVRIYLDDYCYYY